MRKGEANIHAQLNSLDSGSRVQPTARPELNDEFQGQDTSSSTSSSLPAHGGGRCAEKAEYRRCEA